MQDRSTFEQTFDGPIPWEVRAALYFGDASLAEAAERRAASRTCDRLAFALVRRRARAREAQAVDLAMAEGRLRGYRDAGLRFIGR